MENNENQEEMIEGLLDDNLTTEKEIETDKGSSNYLILDSGDALHISNTYSIMAKENTKLIILVGAASSGKTTIQTTLYQLFQRGAVGKFWFAGSETMQGYEQRSFHTRLKSKNRTPMTLRTSTGVEDSFLHLKLYNHIENKYYSLLFADLSGEDFETHIADVKSTKTDFPFMTRANQIVAVLDGESVINKRKRQSEKEKIIALLKTFCDADLINGNCKLNVVYSKVDLFSKCQQEDIEVYFNQVKKDVEMKFQGFFVEIEFFDISAMPEQIVEYSMGYGIDKLLERLTQNSVGNESGSGDKVWSIDSEFDKLSYKIVEEN